MTTELYEVKVSDSGIAQVTAKLDGMGAASKKAANDVKGLTDSTMRLAQMLTTLVSLHTGRMIIGIVDELGQLNSRLKLVTASTGDFVAVQKELYDIANRSYKSYRDVSELFIRSAASLKQYGYSHKDALKAVEAFNGGLVISQSSADKAATALDAWSKAIQIGRIGTKEWLSLMNSAPTFMEELRTALGKSTGEFRAMAAAGQLSVKTIMDALEKATPEIMRKVDEMPVSFADAMTKMRNQVGKFFDELENKYKIVATLTEWVKDLADNIDSLSIAVGALVVAGSAFVAVGLAAAMVSMLNPITLAIAGISTLVSWLIYARNDIILFKNENISLGDAVAGVWDGMKEQVGNAFGFIKYEWNSLVDASSNALDDIDNKNADAADAMRGTWREFLGFTGSMIDSLMVGIRTVINGIKSFVMLVFNTIRLETSRALASIMSTINSVTGAIGKAMSALAEFAGSSHRFDTKIIPMDAINRDIAVLTVKFNESALDFKNSYADAVKEVGTVFEDMFIDMADKGSSYAEKRWQKTLNKMASTVIDDLIGVSDTTGSSVAAANAEREKRSKELEHYTSLINDLNTAVNELTMTNARLEAGEKALNSEEKKAFDIREQIKNGTLKLTDSQKQMVESMLEILVNLAKERELLEYNNTLIKERADAYSETINGMVDTNQKLREQVMTYGMSESAVLKLKRAETQRTIEFLKSSNQFGKSQDAYINNLKEQLKLLDEQINLQERLDANNQAKTFWSDFIKIGDDALTSVLQSGKSFWERFKNYGQTTIASLINSFVMKPIMLRIVASVSGAGVASSIFGSEAVQAAGLSGSGGGSGALGMLSSLSSFGTSNSIGTSIFEMGSNIGGDISTSLLGAMDYSNLAYGIAGALGGLAGSLIGKKLGGKYGGIGGGIGSTVGLAFGPVGSVIGGLLGSVAGGLFGAGGGPKSGGSYTDFNERFFTPSDSDEQLKELIETLRAQVNQTASLLGVTASYGFGIGFDTDPQGTAQDRISYAVKRNEEVIISEFNKELGRGGAGEAISDAVLRMFISAFQNIDISPVLNSLLDNFDIMGASNEEMTKMADAISGSALLYSDTLANALNPAIKAAEELQTEYADLSGSGFATLDSIRQLIDSLDLTDEAARSAATDLLVFASKVNEVNQQILAAVGITAEDTVKQFLAGFANYDNVEDASHAFASSVILSMRNAFLSSYAAQINSIVLDGVISPIVNALITGQTVTEAMSQASLDAALARVKATAEAFNAIWNNDTFQQILGTLYENISEVSKAGYSFELSLPQAMTSYSSAVTTMTTASNDLSSAADQTAQKLEQLAGQIKAIRSELDRFGETPIVKQVNDLTQSYTDQIDKLAELGANLEQLAYATDLYDLKIKALLATELKAATTGILSAEGYGTFGYDVTQARDSVLTQLDNLNKLMNTAGITVENLVDLAGIYWETLTDIQKAHVLDSINMLAQYKNAYNSYMQNWRDTILSHVSSRGGDVSAQETYMAKGSVDKLISDLNKAYNTSIITVENLVDLALQYWDELSDIQKSAIMDASQALDAYVNSLTNVYQAQLDTVKENYNASQAIKAFSKNIDRAIANILISAGRLSSLDYTQSQLVSLKAEADALERMGASSTELVSKYEEILNLTVEVGNTQLTMLRDQMSFAISISNYIAKLKTSEQSPESLEYRLEQSQRIAREYYDIVTGRTSASEEVRANARSQLTGSVDTVLSLARDMFSSSMGYTDIYNEWLALLEPLGDFKSVEQQTFELEQSIAGNVDTMLSELNLLKEKAISMQSAADAQLNISINELNATGSILQSLGAGGAIATLLKDLPAQLAYAITTGKAPSATGSSANAVISPTSQSSTGAQRFLDAMSNSASYQAQQVVEDLGNGWTRYWGVPAYATGGSANDGWYLAGEHGPEPIFASGSHTIVSNDAARMALGNDTSRLEMLMERLIDTLERSERTAEAYQEESTQAIVGEIRQLIDNSDTQTRYLKQMAG